MSFYSRAVNHFPVSSNRLQRSLRATFTGLATNIFLSAAKLIAGIAGGSHALVADAMESLTDIFSSLIVWRGVVVASEPADADHPYGHGKAEPIAAALVAALLLFVAGWITIGALHDVAQPRPPPKWFTLLVLLVVIAVKEGLFQFVSREAAAVRSPAVHADAWHHRSDAISSVAAAVGISVALAGGEKLFWADDAAAVAAACVIAWNGWHLLRPTLSDLMDRAPDRTFGDKIQRLAEAIPGVARVEKCVVRKMGHQLYVDMHVEVDPQMTVLRSHDIAHDVKDKVREAMPAVRDVLVHIEPLNIAARQDKNRRLPGE
ncbi:MAG: cation transporter [Verrucomicrobiota bacterium]|nr:cation transporter [Verrucomicrobiota bacterium]